MAARDTVSAMLHSLMRKVADLLSGAIDPESRLRSARGHVLALVARATCLPASEIAPHLDFLDEGHMIRVIFDATFFKRCGQLDAILAVAADLT